MPRDLALITVAFRQRLLGHGPFVLKLGGPFGAVVPGRLSPFHLLSEWQAFSLPQTVVQRVLVLVTAF
jgi:hypothetical protein